MTVDQIIDEIIKNEGSKFTNDPQDSGGPTKYGITQKSLSVYLHHPATIEDVQNLTEAQARIIYRSTYYNAPHFNLLPEALQPVVTDFGVNAGPGAAVEALQVVLNMAGFECKEDGMLGPATAAMANKAYEAMGGLLVNAYVDYRIWFYEKLVERRPKDSKYLVGWRNRANRFRISG
jgi:lysozyme family protein